MGKEVAANCGEALTAIVSQIEEVKQLTCEITAAIQEQTTGLGEINKAIQLFDKVTHESTNTAEKSAGVSDSLMEQYKGLEVVIGNLKEMIQGRQQGTLQTKSASPDLGFSTDDSSENSNAA